MKAIEAKRTLPVERVIAAIGIPNVGKRTAKLLAPLFQSREDLFAFSHTIEELENIKDIGPGTAESIVTYFETHKNLLQRLLERIEIIYSVPSQNETIESGITGKSFCVTGSFELASRDQIHETIEKHGGEVRTGVTKKLDYLIAGEAAGSKLEKAQSLGVPVIDYAGFLELMK